MNISDFHFNKELSFVFCEIIDGAQELEALIKKAVKFYKTKPKCSTTNSRILSLTDAKIINESEKERLKKIIGLRNYFAHQYFIDKGAGIFKYKFEDIKFCGDYKQDLELAKKMVWESIT